MAAQYLLVKRMKNKYKTRGGGDVRFTEYPTIFRAFTITKVELRVDCQV